MAVIDSEQKESLVKATPVKILLESEMVVPALVPRQGVLYEFSHNTGWPDSGKYKALHRTAQLLEAMRRDGVQPFNAPQLLEVKLAAAQHDRIKSDFHMTTTLLATGRTRKGSLVHAVVHYKGHPFTDPERLRRGEMVYRARNVSYAHNYPTGAVVLDDAEFWAILDREGGTKSDVKEVYVFPAGEAKRTFLADDHYKWWSPNPLSGKSLAHRNRLLTAFTQGEKRKSRLLTKLTAFAQKNNMRDIDLFDYDSICELRGDADAGANVARFLCFYNYSNLKGTIAFCTGNFYNNDLPIFMGIPQLPAANAPSLECVVAALSGAGIITPENVKKAIQQLRHFYS